MPESEDHTESTLPDPLGTKHTRGTHPRSLANLRPPWRPGETPNPSGLTKDGRPTKTAKIDAELARQLARKRHTEKLVARWIKDAIEDEVDGSTRSKAREQILQRLYPVPQDEAGKRVVLEGLKLELTPGGGASVTMQRATGELPAPSFADETSKESYGGTTPVGDSRDVSLLPLLLPPQDVVLEGPGTSTGPLGPTPP